MAGATLPSPGSARRWPASRRLSAAGCGDDAGVSESKIVTALDLQQAGQGYRMGGDPFCTVEASQRRRPGSAANDSADASGSVIAGPDGEVGVVAPAPLRPRLLAAGQAGARQLERRSE